MFTRVNGYVSCLCRKRLQNRPTIALTVLLEGVRDVTLFITSYEQS